MENELTTRSIQQLEAERAALCQQLEQWGAALAASDTLLSLRTLMEGLDVELGRVEGELYRRQKREHIRASAPLE